MHHFLAMGFLFPTVSTSSLLCEESCESIIGFFDAEGEAPELNMDLVGSLLQQEKEQLACIETGDYFERLNNGGVESRWRTEAIQWFGKVRAHYNFEPQCVYLAANYRDRFLSATVPDDKEWVQQLLSVACLSIAAKMEETEVPPCVDLQFCNVKQIFDSPDIKRMEIFLLKSLNWRVKAVTPFSYISDFVDKVNEGNSLTNECISRCTELILGTLKETTFLQFMPSEIAAAVVLYAVAENKDFDVNIALLASEFPVDKEKVRRCYGEIQDMALVETSSSSSASPSVPKSPSDVC